MLASGQPLFLQLGKLSVYHTPSRLRLQFFNVIEGLRERTEYIDIFLFFRPLLNHVLFPMVCLLVEGECQISVF